MSKPSYVYVTYIETSIDRLWQALTDGDFTERYWFGYRVASDWTPGSAYRFTRADTTAKEGKVLAADPPRRLAYTWDRCSSGPEVERSSRVTFDLEPRAVAKAVADAGQPVEAEVLVEMALAAEHGAGRDPRVLRNVQAETGADIKALDRLGLGSSRQGQQRNGQQAGGQQGIPITHASSPVYGLRRPCRGPWPASTARGG